MTVPKKLLFSDLIKHNVRCDSGIDHGPVISPWMHPPVHRILGLITRPSNLIKLSCNSPTTPAVFSPINSDVNFTYLVMPIQIRN